MVHSDILELEYAATETSRDIIRLSHDHKGRVYIMTKHCNDPFSVPYDMAAAGVLYRFSSDSKLEEYKMSEEEIKWIERIGSFALELSRCGFN
jgi:hypothetical protein